jgi:hypothetical protein
VPEFPNKKYFLGSYTKDSNKEKEVTSGVACYIRSINMAFFLKV